MRGFENPTAEQPKSSEREDATIKKLAARALALRKKWPWPENIYQAISEIGIEEKERRERLGRLVAEELGRRGGRTAQSRGSAGRKKYGSLYFTDKQMEQMIRDAENQARKHGPEEEQ